MPRQTGLSKRWLYGAWLVLILGFAALHALHLRADFPNDTAWVSDWAKYTDEGWYADAAVRAHLTGSWYVAGDFNPGAAVPAFAFLEWVLFFFTGVTIEAARGLAVAFFFTNLLLSYLLVRARGPRWAGLLAATLLATSPFLYCFSRLAILEPMQTALTLGIFNLAVRAPRMRRPVWVAASIGLLFAVAMLTKTSAAFLLPAVGWVLLMPLRERPRQAAGCGAAALGTFALAYGSWLALLAHWGLLADYQYFFFVNKYVKPTEYYWPLLSAYWAFHGGLWVDHILVPLAGLVVLGALAAWVWVRGPKAGPALAGWSGWGGGLLLDPAFGGSALAVAGYLFFMTYQNHPQPRYFALVAVFCFILVAKAAGALAVSATETGMHSLLLAACALIALAAVAAGINGAHTLNYAAHPEYTYVNAAEHLTQYMDAHPNGKRILLSISADQIALITHVETLCDDFGTQDLPGKMAVYQPGWYAAWNDLDPGTLEDLHVHYSLEQVASFRALDDPDRNVLVLFKLHPLPGGKARDEGEEDLKVPQDGDKIDIPVE